MADLQTITFPAGFLWGTATASHQVEGQNTNNNWYAWEHTPGKITLEHTSGLACDWWGGRWQEDFDRAAASGQNAHRLSIEWSRIQPAPDRWDDQALAFYVDMAAGLRSRGMTPVVTLHHFSDPLWLAEQGGWENERTPERFAAFVHRVVPALADHVTLWCTVNEPNVYAVSSYLFGEFPPGKQDLRATFRVMRNLADGHARAYHAIHDLQPQARVGIPHHYRDFAPADPAFAPDRWVTGWFNRLFNRFFADAAADGVLRFPGRSQRLAGLARTQDFFGLNYYTRELCDFSPLAYRDLMVRRYYRPDAALSDTGFLAHEPEGFAVALAWARSYGLPVIVTENGVEDADDHLRPLYLTEHIAVMGKAWAAGCPVEGYFHWSLVDNFEWERGWTQRFGLWELDTETQERRKRPSADVYAAICRANAIAVAAD